MTTIMTFAAIFMLVWFMSTLKLGIATAWHHFWIGIALLILALILTWPWLAIIAVIVIADDAIQHAVQLRWPAFRSPLHLLYRHTLYKWTHKETA